MSVKNIPKQWISFRFNEPGDPVPSQESLVPLKALIFRSHVLGLRKLLSDLDDEGRRSVMRDLPDLLIGTADISVTSMKWSGE